MGGFAYRAIDRRGHASSGEIEARDRTEALLRIRQTGVTPVEVRAIKAANGGGPARFKVNVKVRAEVTRTLDELGVLLNAGLPLDRALALCVDNIGNPGVAAEFRRLLAAVREGATLSYAMAERPTLFPASAQAIIEAGEANGALGDALARVAHMFGQAEKIRRQITGAMIYPAALMLLAGGVILVMLLYVVPQFESVFATAPQGKLPASTRAMMAASRALRDHDLVIAGVVAALAFGIRQLLRHPGTGAVLDRVMLRLPQIGTLVRHIEAARLARTLGGLLEGGVPLPFALAMSCRAISNRTIATAIAGVAVQVREGGALTGLITATGMLPRMATGFIRTGEETSQLGMMLERLADVLERDVTLRIERLVAVLTPVITICLGAAVAAIIASIMTAILGFNDLAVN